MSIRRYTTKYDLELADEPEGEWVRYSDHVAAVEAAVEAEGKSWQETVENLLDRAERAEEREGKLRRLAVERRTQVNDLKARLIQANERAAGERDRIRQAVSKVWVENFCYDHDCRVKAHILSIIDGGE